MTTRDSPPTPTRDTAESLHTPDCTERSRQRRILQVEVTKRAFGVLFGAYFGLVSDVSERQVRT